MSEPSEVQQQSIARIQNEWKVIANPDWLPPGWVTIAVTRQGGSTQGSVDKYYYSPEGKKCRSRLEVSRFLKAKLRVSIPKPHPISYASIVSKIEKVFYEIEEMIAETESLSLKPSN